MGGKKDDDSDDGGKSKKKSKDAKKSNKNKEVEDEAFDDSEYDDRQDREVDYMSDESSDSDKDEEDDEDETGKKKKKKSSSRGNSDDEEEGKGKKKGSTNNSRSGTPTKDVEKTDKAEKRKAMVANLLDPNAEGAPAKKSRLEQFGAAAPAAMQGNEAISEEAVRRYLKRRPMTTTDLLKKFRSKKTGIQNAQLVQLLANILKKINPHKHKVKGVTYLSLKEEK